MLGEILGLRAGDTVACEMLCLFLLERPPREGFDSSSCELFENLMPVERGVLSALSLGVLADKVGVLSPSSRPMLVSISSKVRDETSAAATPKEMSSIFSGD